MGVTYRPGIVQGDLKLSVDVFNPRSYPGSGGTWYDLSGNANNLTGSAAYLTSTGLVSGSAWSTSTTNILNTDCYTICYSLKLNSSVTYPEAYSGSWDKLFSYNAGGSDRSPSIWRFPSERTMHWRNDPNNTGDNFNTASGQFAINTWYYISVMKTGSLTKMYINGTWLQGGSGISSPKTRGSAPVILFESYTANLAQIGCLQIYARELTASEVSQNFTAIRGNYGI